MPLANAILASSFNRIRSAAIARRTRASARNIVAAGPALFPCRLDDKMGKSSTACEHGQWRRARWRRRRCDAKTPSACHRPGGAACDPRAMRIAGPTSGLAPGFVQGNLAILPQALGGGLLAVLPAQPETMPADRHVGAGRSARAGARRGSRHPHRPAALPRLARRRAGRRADGRARILARRSGQLRHRLLVFLRGSADRATASSCAT